MPIKKPPPSPSTIGPAFDSTVVAKPSTKPNTGKNPIPKPGSRPEPDNRWQRTKRYGWDSR